MTKHALLIGISKFNDDVLGTLNAPAKDVHALANVLNDPARGGFDAITTSLDEDIETIRGKVADLLDHKNRRDTVLFYYSGHGIADIRGQLFLATGKTMKDRPRLNSLAASELRDMMSDSTAGQLILIFDCCHSGAFMEGAKGSATPVSTQTFSAGDGAEGEYVLMSCNSLQVSLDSADGATSSFTSWMVDGLANSEAAPDQAEITLDDLYSYVCRRARAAGSVMTPQRLVQRNAGVQVIARNPAPTPPELPTDVLERLAGTEWTARMAAVQALEALARQDRLRGLVRSAVAARLPIERDRDVSDALERLLARLRSRDEAPRPPPPLEDPQPPPREAPQKAPQEAPPSSSPPPPPPTTALTSWQQKVLQRAGLSQFDPTARPILETHAVALRNATREFWAALVAVVGLPILAWSMAHDRENASVAWFPPALCLACSIIGLTRRPQTVPPAATDAARIAAAVPITRFAWHNYESRLFRRYCLVSLFAGGAGLVAAIAGMANAPSGAAFSTTQMSTNCTFKVGPRRGQTDNLAGLPGVFPAPLGSGCTDGRGSVGFVPY